jgi:hypothetical protein
MPYPTVCPTICPTKIEIIIRNVGHCSHSTDNQKDVSDSI